MVIVTDHQSVQNALRIARSRWKAHESRAASESRYAARLRAEAKAEAYRSMYCRFKAGLEVVQ